MLVLEHFHNKPSTQIYGKKLWKMFFLSCLNTLFQASPGQKSGSY